MPVPWKDGSTASTGSGFWLSQRYDGDIPGWGGLARHDEFFAADLTGNGTDDLVIFFGHQFDHHSTVTDERVDQAGLGLLSKGMFLHEADRVAISRVRGPYRHHTHKNSLPFTSLLPRKNSCALTGLPPAR